MSAPFFIIAGTQSEAHNWMATNFYSPAKAVYVSEPSILRGQHNPHGIFIGTWWSRKDAFDILVQLKVCSSDNNPKLTEAAIFYESKLNENKFY